jgi:hypothetical protein
MANGSGRLTELTASELHEKRAHSGGTRHRKHSAGQRLQLAVGSAEGDCRVTMLRTYARRQGS